MDVHHVDGDITNDNLPNLRPVCRSCHVATHEVKNTKWLRGFGVKWSVLKMSISRARKWEEIKDLPNAVFVGYGIGYIAKSKWRDETGYTLSQIGKRMNLTKERVRQLLSEDPERVRKYL